MRSTKTASRECNLVADFEQTPNVQKQTSLKGLSPFHQTCPRGLRRYTCMVLQSPKEFQQNFSILSSCSGDD